jgi:hypothetical protein
VVSRIAVAILTAVLAAIAPAAHVTYVPAAHKLWLGKTHDLLMFGGRTEDFTWVSCGISAGPCSRGSRGQILTFTSYWALGRAIASGRLRRGRTILFDQEGWGATPTREHAHPDRYLRLAALLAHAHGITIIETPYVKGAGPLITEDVAAARYADVVDIQSQRYVAHPDLFATFVSQDIAAMRAVSPSVKILAGLAPDAGGTPVTAGQMYRSYASVYSEVGGYWLNAAPWAPPRGKGCAPVGCPAVVHRFLNDIRFG